MENIKYYGPGEVATSENILMDLIERTKKPSSALKKKDTSVSKSLYIPAVSVEINRFDIVKRFSPYGQIHRIDFSEDYQNESDETVGDVFVHFYSYNPEAEDGYMEYQHMRNQPMFTYICNKMVSVRPYKSKYQESVSYKNESILELKKQIKKLQYEKKYEIWKHNRDWKKALDESWNYVAKFMDDLYNDVPTRTIYMDNPEDFYVPLPY